MTTFDDAAGRLREAFREAEDLFDDKIQTTGQIETPVGVFSFKKIQGPVGNATRRFYLTDKPLSRCSVRELNGMAPYLEPLWEACVREDTRVVEEMEANVRKIQAFVGSKR